jgi:hypothetical protein
VRTGGFLSRYCSCHRVYEGEGLSRFFVFLQVACLAVIVDSGVEANGYTSIELRMSCLLMGGIYDGRCVSSSRCVMGRMWFCYLPSRLFHFSFPLCVFVFMWGLLVPVDSEDLDLSDIPLFRRADCSILFMLSPTVCDGFNYSSFILYFSYGYVGGAMGKLIGYTQLFR